MTRPFLSANDYPTAEKHPDQVAGSRGKPLGQLTLEAAEQGDLAMEDLHITPEALLRQAQIARSAGRAALAANFERAAEMTSLSQDEVMRIYEMLRPGRADSKQVLLDAAQDLKTRHNTPRLAEFLEQAADLYDRRGLFRSRY